MQCVAIAPVGVVGVHLQMSIQTNIDQHNQHQLGCYNSVAAGVWFGAPVLIIVNSVKRVNIVS